MIKLFTRKTPHHKQLIQSLRTRAKRGQRALDKSIKKAEKHDKRAERTLDKLERGRTEITNLQDILSEFVSNLNVEFEQALEAMKPDLQARYKAIKKRIIEARVEEIDQMLSLSPASKSGLIEQAKDVSSTYVEMRLAMQWAPYRELCERIGDIPNYRTARELERCIDILEHLEQCKTNDTLLHLVPQL